MRFVGLPLGCGELQLNLHLYDFFQRAVGAAGEIPWRRKHLSLLRHRHQLNSVRLATHNKTKTFIISYEFLVPELATISRDMQLAKRERYTEAGREWQTVSQVRAQLNHRLAS